jgi:hypothetical protein
MKESDLQRVAADWMTLHNIKWWRMPLGAVMHQVGGKMVYKKNPLKGFPDIAGVLRRRDRGRFFAIELKTKTGKLSPEQIMWQIALEESGAAVTVVRSVDEMEAFFLSVGELKSSGMIRVG